MTQRHRAKKKGSLDSLDFDHTETLPPPIKIKSIIKPNQSLEHASSASR